MACLLFGAAAWKTKSRDAFIGWDVTSRERFKGTCYRAAGWLHVGATTGRSRNDTDFTLSVPVKEVYLQPLTADFRRRLCA